MAYREMDPTKTGLLHMASRRSNSYFTAYPNSPTPPGVNHSSFGPVRTSTSSQGSGGSHRFGGEMRVIRRHAVVLWIGFILILLILCLLGVL